MRLFIGLPVPVGFAQTLTGLAQHIELPKARRTAPEEAHITLVFLGEVKEERIPCIRREVERLELPRLLIRLLNLGTFPHAGVLFAEIDAERTLMALQSQVAGAMARCGFDPERRPYQPHITLARFRPPARLSRNQLILPAEMPRTFSADTVNLYRSHLMPTGSHYEVLLQKRAAEE